MNDKYKLTKSQNQKLAWMNIVNLVHVLSRLENVNTTLAQTKTIMDGVSVGGISTHDQRVIENLKAGWNYIIDTNDSVDLSMLQKINKIVAADDSLAPGEFRTGNGLVTLGTSEDFVPSNVDIDQEKKYLNSEFSTNDGTTEKALKIMYHNMRAQLFWDGNKRTAILFANKIMINNGAGLINIPLNLWEKWNTLLSEFYRSGNSDEIVKWTYENGIFGIDLN